MNIRRAVSLFVVTYVIYILSRLFLGRWRDEAEFDESRVILGDIGEEFHITNPPFPGVVDFWFKWAEAFDAAKPKIPPIESGPKADTADLMIPDDHDRTPPNATVGLTNSQIDSMRRSHEKILWHPELNDTYEEARKLFNGTGIVTVAGGWYYGPSITSIRMLRKTNSTLPVQVFLQSASEYEPEICEEVLPALNAECFVIEDYLREESPFKVSRFQLKVLAILFSSFDNVLFLDSDCIPLHDPRLLLENEPFTSYGFVSWPDYWIATEDAAFYKIAGFPSYPTGLPLRSSEAGQLLISKQKHMPSLILAAYYNVYGPTHYYPLFSQGAPGEGDKDTFLAAVFVRNDSYYRVKTKTGTVSLKDHQGNMHDKGMIQHDAVEEYSLRNFTHTAKPRPFFLHANTPKMNVGRLLDDPRHLHMPYTGQANEPTRIWGTKERILRTFDVDIEKSVWMEMVDMACTLGTIMEDWKKRKDVCKRAKEHWNAVFVEKEEERFKIEES